MPTINSVIAEVDRVKVNAYTEEDKATWLSRLDGKISLELLNQAEAVSYSYPADGDKALLIPHPYDDVYRYYLYAMIDLANREYGSYGNNMMMFNSAYQDYASYYARKNSRETISGFRNVL